MRIRSVSPLVVLLWPASAGVLAMNALADWLWEHAALTTVMLVVSVIVLAGSLWLCYYVLVTIPPDYFNRRHPPLAQFRDRPALWWTLVISKNLIGALLAAAGLVMFFTPGQGVLTLLLGISLLDVPGKHALERKIIRRPSVLKVINQLRARTGKPPLEIE